MTRSNRASCLRARFLTITIACYTSMQTLAAPDLVTGDGPSLEKQRDAIKANDPETLESLKGLLKQADSAIRKGLISVTEKTQIPPSGDKRDYLSISPYWWPDPEKKDGLPFIRKDGQVNPTTRGEHVGYDRKGRLYSYTRDLSRAAYLSGNPKYGIAAAQLLEHWFATPETRMNPNLNFGQGVPGRNDGRAAGIIESSGVDNVLSSIQLLRSEDHITGETDRALKKWFEGYAGCLQTSIRSSFLVNSYGHPRSQHHVNDFRYLQALSLTRPGDLSGF